ncbi:hypothetical protein [Pelagibacterium montanilacus]|uniref:hypothetical protein n=1 Tax=Pelagibacterium montanilacus TaxID=2185280 RepID=UPI000F8D3318|nr:hypothetical protein [Pelagibacterium montanilacus]
MIFVRSSVDTTILRICIDTLAAEHGRWRVARAVLVMLLGRPGKQPVVRADTLPDHIKRDIGLPPEGASVTRRGP